MVESLQVVPVDKVVVAAPNLAFDLHRVRTQVVVGAVAHMDQCTVVVGVVAHI